MIVAKIKNWTEFQHCRMSSPAQGGVVVTARVKRKSIGDAKRRAIYERDNGVCQLCGVKTRFFNSRADSPFDSGPRAGSVDHIVPVSRGGTNDPSNLRWACRTCNCARGNRA